MEEKVEENVDVEVIPVSVCLYAHREGDGTVPQGHYTLGVSSVFISRKRGEGESEAPLCPFGEYRKLGGGREGNGQTFLWGR